MGGIIMAGNEISTSGDLVFKPSARAFFVHYVAMFLVFCGPPAQSGGGAARLAGDPPGAHCPGRGDLPEIRPGVPGNLPGGGPGLALAFPPGTGDRLGEPGGDPGAPGLDPDHPPGGQPRLPG